MHLRRSPLLRIQMRSRAALLGFSLIELLIAMAIFGVLVKMAVSSYTSSVAKSKRRSAEACLSSYANYLERFYTTNLRYDSDGVNAMNTAALQALNLDCASSSQTGRDYTYSFTTGQPTRSTYQIQAAPSGAQVSRDATCGTLSLDQTGSRAASGTGTDCW